MPAVGSSVVVVGVEPPPPVPPPPEPPPGLELGGGGCAGGVPGGPVLGGGCEGCGEGGGEGCGWGGGGGGAGQPSGGGRLGTHTSWAAAGMAAIAVAPATRAIRRESAARSPSTDVGSHQASSAWLPARRYPARRSREAAWAAAPYRRARRLTGREVHRPATRRPRRGAAPEEAEAPEASSHRPARRRPVAPPIRRLGTESAVPCTTPNVGPGSTARPSTLSADARPSTATTAGSRSGLRGLPGSPADRRTEAVPAGRARGADVAGA
jgi:hypothetical protein